MTPSEALQWADKNCPPETVEGEAVAALAAEVRRMRYRIECLRGGLKSACWWFRDLDDTSHAEECLELAGDMEPPLKEANDEDV